MPSDGSSWEYFCSPSAHPGIRLPTWRGSFLPLFAFATALYRDPALLGFTMALPDVKSPDPIGTVAFWFGTFWTKVFLILVITSIFALTVVVTGAAARVVYAMARDNMLPFSPDLRKVSRQTQTPVIAMAVTFFVTAAFIQYGYLSGRGPPYP